MCLFLQLKRTTLLLLSGPRAAVLPSPYLDQHGEEDRNLSRGKVLYKNAERWARVEGLWRTAALEFDTVTMDKAVGGRALAGSQMY